MRRFGWLAVIVLVTLAGGDAYAQGAGVRAGVSGDPTQFYGGVHYESSEIVDRLRFRPNLEIGVGDDVTLVAINVEFAYRFPLDRTVWALYVGGGPALNLYRRSEDTDPEGGFNILIGLQHPKGFFTEFKVGALNSPGFKMGAGYTFGR